MKIKRCVFSVIRLTVVFSFALGLVFGQTKTTWAKTDLVFEPAQLNLAPNQTATLNLNLTTTVKILGTDLVIKYDKTAVAVDNVTVGSFWQQPQILVNQNNGALGQINLSVFHYPARSGDGNLVSLSLRSVGSNNSAISVDKATVMASEKGLKADYTAKESSVVVVNPPITPSAVLPTTPPVLTIGPSADRSPVDVSAIVATTGSEIQTGPTIILEQSPSPVTEKTGASATFTLQVLALFLLILGTLAFFTFKKNF